jgi:hypothetical protein
LLFGDTNSSGTNLTARFCIKYNKPGIIIPWISGEKIPETEEFIKQITKYNIQTLNVSGNRESTNPGIFLACKTFLIQALKDNSK